jgi:hypothetical protein
MHDEGLPLPAGTQMFAERIVSGRGVRSLRQRHGEQSGRFVDDHQLIVLVKNLERTMPDLSSAPLRAPRLVHPHANDIAGPDAGTGVGFRRFRSVDENFALGERVAHSAS